ncbi:hypothetical protein MKW94_024005 [Papaver nudicaule]|uniref:ATP-dependent DNA helicase n=1 Tax=Papaver nudicaule TaxID=74823 RepID=A0AA41S4E0_PAPNU|nr:hypothetical protein [Papaver nudicaule]
MAFPTLFPYGKADLRRSRYRKVSECQYFQHLMKYHDGRFARDSRFRYFAWNSLTRWRALTLGSIYVKKFPSDGELSIQSIRDMISSDDRQLLSRISYYAKQIRGTRAYWYTRLKDLIAMVKQLGPPTIFFTLSAADLQWPELYSLLDPENKLETLDPVERRREKGRLMNENPLIVSWFFQKRVSVFFKEYLKKQFLVVDYWYRYEWKNRGSGHVHGFLWLKDSPDVSRIASDEQVRRSIIDYFDNMVCTKNPNPIFSVDIQNHPCARKIDLESNLEDDDDDYASLVNCVMRHTKCGNYCLRISKTTKQKVCRFRFPKEISNVSKLVEEPLKSNMFRFVGERDDDRVNSHNRSVLQTWRANIDWSPVTTVESVTQYIGKYAAKSEPASKTFIDTWREIIEDKRRPCLDSTSAIKRLLIKNASKRDIPAQEVFHLLMGWALTDSSRKVVVLNLSENRLFSSQVRRRRDGDAEEQRETDYSFFERYLARPEEFERTTLFEMAKKHYYVRSRWSTSRVEAIVRILPEFAGTIMPNTENWESFFRQQVLLNSCYRSYEDAKRGFHLWSECYDDLGCSTSNQASHIDTFDDEFEDESDPEDEPDHDWMLLSRMGPNIAPEDEILLGSRTIDLTHNWSEGISHYPSIHEGRTFAHSLSKVEQDTVEEYIPPDLDVALSSLSQQQKAAHDIVLRSMETRSTIRLIVSGGAGTGKSTLINAIVHSTRQLFGKKEAVKIMAPTGIAAFNIGGATIHHELAIAVEKDREYKNLNPELCRRMQEDFQDTKLIVIDEYSMLGRNMFAKIYLRCRDVFANSEHFGNVSVVLVGDIRQLSPVFDTPLYFVGTGDSQLQMLASLSYYLFNRCVRLENVFRQSGDEELEFKDALRRLSDGKSTHRDWRLFRTRDFSVLSSEEQNQFKFALRLFPTKSTASKYNYERLKDLGNPVARITSKNNCEAARRTKSDEAKGLEDVLLLSKGARVMLRKNLSTHYGLVNGSRGVIVDIVYGNGEKSPTHMPIAVMVDFDKYIGPKFQEGSNVIPIIPETTSWISSSGVTCTRTQLPLILCWAITVHKSQGLTLDQAVVDIGPKESLGLTFVALSRTRKLKDLAFSPMFDFDRIEGIGACKGLDLRRKEEERLQQISTATM